jgi:hypothetical protein
VEKEKLREYFLKLKQTSLSIEEQVLIAKQLDDNKGLKNVINNDVLAKNIEKYTLAIHAMSIVNGINKNKCLADILCFRPLIYADIDFYKQAIDVMLKVDEDQASKMWSILANHFLIKEGIKKFTQKTNDALRECCQGIHLNDVSIESLTVIRKNLLDEQYVTSENYSKVVK